MYAVVFPGQGSQRPGMGKDLYELGGKGQLAFQESSDAVGRDLATLCFSSDEQTLRQTDNAQIALYVCGVAAWKELESRLGSKGPEAMAGHSVGEYAALAAAGVISVAEGARLVQRRGELMASAGRARPGAMAAVLGLNLDQVREACGAASSPGSVAVVANDNSPGQVVISGDSQAVGKAGEIALGAGAKRVIPLNVSGAFHSPLMREPAAEMAKALAKARFTQGSCPVISNVTAKPVFDPEEWPSLLERQLESPVLWRDSISYLWSSGVRIFIECGAGEVLGGLIRRIEQDARAIAVSDAAGLERALVEVQ